MNAIVIIPSPLRNLTNGERKVNIDFEGTSSSVKNIIIILKIVKKTKSMTFYFKFIDS